MHVGRNAGGYLCAFLLLAGGCGDASIPQKPHYASENPLYRGQSDFLNLEPASGAFLGGWAWPSFTSYGLSAGSGAPRPAAPQDPPSGRQGRPEEADIYRVAGDRLYYLHTDRGLLVYDIKDPKNPELVARLPVFGTPVEMFVEAGTVFALVSDVHCMARARGEPQLRRQHTSQLVAIDISDPARPAVVGRVDITGKLRAGVSRRVKDTIYVVSSVSREQHWGWNYLKKIAATDAPEQAWVYALDVSDPGSVRAVQRMLVFEGGAYQERKAGASRSRTFQDVTFTATANALMVVENWRKRGDVAGGPGGCGSSEDLQQAIVSIFDISGPGGTIRRHTRFETYGELGDQFKQTYVHDEQTGRGTYFGIFLRREWSSSGCRGTSVLQNRLESWDVTDGDHPARRGSLVFGKPGETVWGSLFDAQRGVAFAITARERRVDPLYAISIVDPGKMKLLSEVDGLSGNINLFRFVGGNEFLVGIGRDDTTTCTGYTNASSGTATNVAVSVIDARKLDQIRLVQRRCVTVASDALRVDSQVNLDRDQAHKMVGLHAVGGANIITVPVHYYSKGSPSSASHGGRWESAVGVMSLDLDRYDPQKSHTEQTVLTNHVTVIHPGGRVQRSVLLTRKGQGGDRRLMINLSRTHLSLVDLDDLDSPRVQSTLEVAPYVTRVFRFGRHLLEQVRPVEVASATDPWRYGNSFTFVVREPGGSAGTGPEVARFQVQGVEAAARYRDLLVLFRWNYETYKARGEVLLYDLSDPLRPRRRGTVDLPVQAMPSPELWFGPRGYRGSFRFSGLADGGEIQAADWLVADGGLVFLTTRDSGFRQSSLELLLVELTNPDRPALTRVSLPASSRLLGLVSDPTDAGTFFLAYKRLVGETTVGQDDYHVFRYYAQRWYRDRGAWQRGQATNLPGRLIRTWTHGGRRVFLTRDFVYPYYSAGWHSDPWHEHRNGLPRPPQQVRLNLLDQADSTTGRARARLRGFHNLGDFYPMDLVQEGDRVLVLSRYFRYYSLYNAYVALDRDEQPPTADRFSDHLAVLELSGATLLSAADTALGTIWASLMGGHQGRLLAGLDDEGILVLEAGQAAPAAAPSTAPSPSRFLRTLESTASLELDGPVAYISAGHAGTLRVDLSTAPVVP
jgi:hypothetical protein